MIRIGRFLIGNLVVSGYYFVVTLVETQSTLIVVLV
jgi:hypothetical protein